ncbi:hypothetical protein Pmani_003462 [Petrolisthes manimaculis]|uniref:Uncharacterized protein n=1 Tax=Petrolisthes manimaculis TaxID=1843537 RepID=A0AAE1QFU6_9EUCA|nr:hypothetical protein Pmani_003462 [Petrolisthes manimaculis]
MAVTSGEEKKKLVGRESRQQESSRKTDACKADVGGTLPLAGYHLSPGVLADERGRKEPPRQINTVTIVFVPINPDQPCPSEMPCPPQIVDARVLPFIPMKGASWVQVSHE